MALIHSRWRGEPCRLVHQELCPHPRGTERLYRQGSQSGVKDKKQSRKNLTFFFLHSFSTVIAGVRLPRSQVTGSGSPVAW